MPFLYFNIFYFSTLIISFYGAIVFLLYQFHHFWWIWLIFLVLNWFISVLFHIYLQMKNIILEKKLFWSFMNFAFPLFGILAWWFYGQHYLWNSQDKKWKEGLKKIEAWEATFSDSWNLKDYKIQTQKNLTYCQKFWPNAFFKNVEYQLIFSKYEKIKMVEKDILNAKKYIYINYYMFNDGEILDWLVDLLIKKRQKGIKVYIIYCFLDWEKKHSSNLKKLKAAGVQLANYQKNWKLKRNLFFINHRKTIIIDGAISYAGGFNIGNPYANLSKVYGYWIDTHIRLIGKITKSIEAIFLKDWLELTGILLEESFQTQISNSNLKPANNNFCQVIDGTMRNKDPINKNFFQNLIANAEKSVEIYSPYLFLDEILIQTLITSSLAGVKIKIFIPGLASTKFVVDNSRLYYQRLIDSGVEIYEFDNLYIHSKVTMIDDKWATIGSFNFDFHSFYYASEITILFKDPAIVKKIAYNLNIKNAKSFNLIKKNPLSKKNRFYVLLLKFFKIAEIFY